MDQLQITTKRTGTPGDALRNNMKKPAIIEEIGTFLFGSAGMMLSYQSLDEPGGVSFAAGHCATLLCRLIHSAEEGRCSVCRRTSIEDARFRPSAITNIYHAGLAQTPSPLIFLDRKTGCSPIGQLLLEPQTTDLLEAIAAYLDSLKYNNASPNQTCHQLRAGNRLQVNIFAKLIFFFIEHIYRNVDNEYLRRELQKKGRQLAKITKKKTLLEFKLMNLNKAVIELDRQKQIERNEIQSSTDNLHLFSKAQIFIKTHYNKDIKLKDVASVMNLSPNYFSSLFKKETGYSFSKYLLKVRIDKAKYLLIHSNLPIKAIVFQVGFNDYNYFNKTFRDATSLPPAAYRQKHSRRPPGDQYSSQHTELIRDCV